MNAEDGNVQRAPQPGPQLANGRNSSENRASASSAMAGVNESVNNYNNNSRNSSANNADSVYPQVTLQGPARPSYTANSTTNINSNDINNNIIGNRDRDGSNEKRVLSSFSGKNDHAPSDALLAASNHPFPSQNSARKPDSTRSADNPAENTAGFSQVIGHTPGIDPLHHHGDSVVRLTTPGKAFGANNVAEHHPNEPIPPERPSNSTNSSSNQATNVSVPFIAQELQPAVVQEPLRADPLAAHLAAKPHSRAVHDRVELSRESGGDDSPSLHPHTTSGPKKGDTRETSTETQTKHTDPYALPSNHNFLVAPLQQKPTGSTKGPSNSSEVAIPRSFPAEAGQPAHGVPTAALNTHKVADTVISNRSENDPLSRPCAALTTHLVALYKQVNAKYCLQRRQESPGPKFNNGFDDREGHYIILPGEEILQRYTVQEVLGKGSFGTVVKCYDEKRRETVALKITRQGANFRNQAKLELDILIRLNENPNLNYLVVKLLKVFEWQGHLVLVFELLSFNLYQLIKCTRYNGVSLDLVRKFAYQLVHTLLALENTKPYPIIHCDLKPENILLRNQNRSGIRLIDFGSACYANKKLHRYIQSRFYRSPEVILYLDYGTAIDRWSLGCLLVELHTGMPLFDGRTEAAQLARFEATLGPVPPDMLAASNNASKFYSGNVVSGYRLKESPLPRRSLESVLGVTTGGPRGNRKHTPGHDEKNYREFLDFIEKLLRYRPEERIGCEAALKHPFLAPLYSSEQNANDPKKQAKSNETAT